MLSLNKTSSLLACIGQGAVELYADCYSDRSQQEMRLVTEGGCVQWRTSCEHSLGA